MTSKTTTPKEASALSYLHQIMHDHEAQTITGREALSRAREAIAALDGPAAPALTPDDAAPDCPDWTLHAPSVWVTAAGYSVYLYQSADSLSIEVYRPGEADGPPLDTIDIGEPAPGRAPTYYTEETIDLTPSPEMLAVITAALKS